MYIILDDPVILINIVLVEPEFTNADFSINRPFSVLITIELMCSVFYPSFKQNVLTTI